MELIIQTLSRSGKVVAQQKVCHHSISIGRAYDNQIILEDIHVSEHHARIVQNEQGEVLIEDLNSLNHLYSHDKSRVTSAVAIQSGDEFYLGKLRIKILYPDHPVADTIALTKSEETAELFSSKRFNAIILTLFVALYAVGLYLEVFSEFEFKQLFTPILSLLLGLAIWPIFWSLLSRFFKHEARFWAHTATLVLTLLSLKLLSALGTLLAYNINTSIATGFKVVVGFIIIFSCLRFSLYLFNQKNDRRQLWLSFSLTCFIFGLLSLGFYTKHRDFSPLPSYSGIVLPNQFLLRDSISIEEFVNNNQSLYTKTRQAGIKDQEADKTSDSDEEAESAE